ncbi:hypothetical protein JOD20_002883 [Herpetosiphon giganteus]|nr:hypothetical protein [Herpetosiphon giganteus]
MIHEGHEEHEGWNREAREESEGKLALGFGLWASGTIVAISRNFQ